MYNVVLIIYKESYYADDILTEPKKSLCSLRDIFLYLNVNEMLALNLQKDTSVKLLFVPLDNFTC